MQMKFFLAKLKPLPEGSWFDAWLKEAIQLAPSASNMQPYQFIIIKDDELKAELARAAKIQRFIKKAAVIFIGIGDPTRERWYKVDVAIAMQQLALQAKELGLGSCWLGAFEEDVVKEVLKIPKSLRVVALMPIGIPAQDPPARPRKSFEELFSIDYYS